MQEDIVRCDGMVMLAMFCVATMEKGLNQYFRRVVQAGMSFYGGKPLVD